MNMIDDDELEDKKGMILIMRRLIFGALVGGTSFGIVSSG